MSRAIDIEQELSKLTFLEGRTRETTLEEEEAAFAVLANYRGSGVREPDARRDESFLRADQGQRHFQEELLECTLLSVVNDSSEDPHDHDRSSPPGFRGFCDGTGEV
jgi:hypothetical protein